MRECSMGKTGGGAERGSAKDARAGTKFMQKGTELAGQKRDERIGTFRKREKTRGIRLYSRGTGEAEVNCFGKTRAGKIIPRVRQTRARKSRLSRKQKESKRGSS